MLDATVTVLAAAGGSDAATMHEIARRSGVAKTTLIDRFGGKPALVDRALTRERRRLADHLVSAYQVHRDETAREQVEHGFRAFFGYATSEPASFAALFGSPSSRQPPDREAHDDVVAAVSELIASRFAAAGVDLEVGAKVIATAITGVGQAVARLVAAEGLDPAVMARFLADLVTNGLSRLDVGLLFEANSAVPARPRGALS